MLVRDVPRLTEFTRVGAHGRHGRDHGSVRRRARPGDDSARRNSSDGRQTPRRCSDVHRDDDVGGLRSTTRAVLAIAHPTNGAAAREMSPSGGGGGYASVAPKPSTGRRPSMCPGPDGHMGRRKQSAWGTSEFVAFAGGGTVMGTVDAGFEAAGSCCKLSAHHRWAIEFPSWSSSHFVRVAMRRATRTRVSARARSAAR